MIFTRKMVIELQLSMKFVVVEVQMDPRDVEAEPVRVKYGIISFHHPI